MDWVSPTHLNVTYGSHAQLGHRVSTLAGIEIKGGKYSGRDAWPTNRNPLLAVASDYKMSPETVGYVRGDASSLHRPFHEADACNDRLWLGGSVRAAGSAVSRGQVRRLHSLGLDGLLDRLAPSSLVASSCRRFTHGSSGYGGCVREAPSLIRLGCLSAHASQRPAARPRRSSAVKQYGQGCLWRLQIDGTRPYHYGAYQQWA